MEVISIIDLLMDRAATVRAPRCDLYLRSPTVGVSTFQVSPVQTSTHLWLVSKQVREQRS